MDQKTPGFTMAMKNAFGVVNGTKVPLAQFSSELKELTPADKQWFADAFAAEGTPCLPPDTK